eukprot:1157510-Pelagomonas_calceolata.AAC.20
MRAYITPCGDAIGTLRADGVGFGCMAEMLDHSAGPQAAFQQASNSCLVLPVLSLFCTPHPCTTPWNRAALAVQGIGCQTGHTPLAGYTGQGISVKEDRPKVWCNKHRQRQLGSLVLWTRRLPVLCESSNARRDGTCASLAPGWHQYALTHPPCFCVPRHYKLRRGTRLRVRAMAMGAWGKETSKVRLWVDPRMPQSGICSLQIRPSPSFMQKTTETLGAVVRETTELEQCSHSGMSI